MDDQRQIRMNEFEQMKKDIKELRDIVQPIADVYAFFTTLGGYGKYLLWLIGSIVAIVVGIKQIFK